MEKQEAVSRLCTDNMSFLAHVYPQEHNFGVRQSLQMRLVNKIANSPVGSKWDIWMQDVDCDSTESLRQTPVLLQITTPKILSTAYSVPITSCLLSASYATCK